jgi:hypothetical protein
MLPLPLASPSLSLPPFLSSAAWRRLEYRLVGVGPLTFVHAHVLVHAHEKDTPLPLHPRTGTRPSVSLPVRRAIQEIYE